MVVFDGEQARFARKFLDELGSDGVKNNNRPFGTGKGLLILEDFTGDSIKRSRLVDSQFTGSDFSMAAVTGSQFTRVDFDNCHLLGANFQNCDFLESTFHADDWERKVIQFCHFGQSSFVNCSFDAVLFSGCSFHQVTFQGSHFNGAQIESSTLEGAEFIGCKLTGIELSHINLDFATFQNCQMSKVGFALYQVPYTFGLLDYLLSTDDDVWLSVSKDGVEREVELDEYREILPYLEVYYADLEEYFPLANLMLATERREEAYDCVIAGIKKAMGEFDFRMVEYFAQLATQNNIFSMAEKKQIYSIVEQTALEKVTKAADMHRYLLHKSWIRDILLNDMYGQQTLEMSFETSIPMDDFEAASELGQMLNEVCERYTDKKSIHRVELRHSSNFQIIMTIGANLTAVLSCLTAVMNTVVAGMNIKKMQLGSRAGQEPSIGQEKFEAQIARLEGALREKEQAANFSFERKVSSTEGALVSETVEKMSFSLPASAMKYISPQDMMGLLSLSGTPESVAR